MPRNGSGNFSLPTNSWNPAVNGVPATAADWQAQANDIAQGLTQSLSRDGQTVVTGNLQMGDNKLTNLSAGAAAGESLRFEQLFSQGQPQDLASAATTDIGAQLTTVLNITGTTAITSFGTNYNGPRFLRFAGALTLTHSAALVLPGAANITTAAGDSAIVVPVGTPAAGWRVVAYQVAANAPGAAPDYVKKVGDTMTGPLVLPGNAASALQAVPKQQLDTATQAITRAGIASLTVTVAANAMTGTLAAETLDFRSSTLTSGTPVARTAAAAVALVVPSGATLGTVNGVAARIVWGWLDNAGTLEPFVVNLSGGVNLDETTLISTTAISAASNSTNVIYSQTARTNVAFRVRGFCDITEATAGTWVTAPTLVQGTGGQALAALSSLGYGQTWQSVTRTGGTTYYNSTGKPIVLYIDATTSGNNVAGAVSLSINGGAPIAFGRGGGAGVAQTFVCADIIIPVGASYVITYTNIAASPSVYELR